MRVSVQVSINKVVKFLIASDVALSTGWGFIAPIFAIFVTEQIDGSIAVVGIATGMYWVVKSVVQPFLAKYLDGNHGEIDDFYFLVGGLFISGLIPLGYLFINSPWQLYAVEFIHAIAMACVIPTWSAVFTRHIDKGEEAFDWSIDSTALGFGAGIAGILGGVLVEAFGFEAVFLLVSVFTMLSVVVLFPIRPLIAPKGHRLARPAMKKPPFTHEKGAF